MTTIRLVKMRITNFKGQRYLEVDFDPNVTYIIGGNETGKTTIMDAFIWTMFGKDSLGRSDFNIKTLDSENHVIPKLEHEVVVTLDVDGTHTTFRRCYKENWVKKRGAVEAVMEGHSVDYYVDDVPLGKREYDRRVSDICPEQLFRQITNPAYFPSLKMQEQRAMLFDIVGDITNEDVLNSLITIKNKHDYDPLIEAFNSRKSLEDLKTQVVSQKNMSKKEISDIPGRIEENNRNMPEAQDWVSIRKQIEDKKAEISAIDDQIADKSEIGKAISDEKNKLRKDIDSKSNQLSDIIREIKKKANADYEKWYFALQGKKSELSRAEGNLSSLRSDLEFHLKDLQRLRDRRSELLTHYYEINAMTFNLDERAMVCPTCKRPFDGDLYSQQLSLLTNEFNKSKSEQMDANKSLGKNIAGQIAKKEETVNEFNGKIDELLSKIADLKADIENEVRNEPQKLDIEEELKKSEDYVLVSGQIEDLRKELDKERDLPDMTGLKESKLTIQAEIDRLNRELAKEDQIKRTINRNEELERILRQTQERIAEFERLEQAILNFMKAKVALVEERINGAFSYVRFKMFGKQVDGTEYDTCECMVNGVPYSDLNTAAKINAGIDIINAISLAKGVTAPIFIDNRESVCDLIPCHSQLINLVVEKGRRLTIQ